MMQNDAVFVDVLRRYYGYDNFRGIQLDIIRSIASGHDTLGLMPTGGGKSITFQVPALTMEGVCIIITPLISLMKDQVEHLKQRNISAEAIHSGLSHYDIQKILDNTIYGAVKFLYISPERIASKLFIAKLYYMKVCFVTVDEAHCISQWGYDFRPSYLQISRIREYLKDVPILALTATATERVVKDIQQKLLFGEYSEAAPNFFRMSFKRSNLSYVVRKTNDKEAEMLHILRSVPGSAIVYTRSREKTKELSSLFSNAGLASTYYHAGLDNALKNRNQEMWQSNAVRVIVATNAFGMGIDKPDVRLVIHADVPDSLEAYFQEAGRAGRDGKRSYAVLLYESADRKVLLRQVEDSFPPKKYIRKVYDHLAYFFELAVESGHGARYEFNEGKFCVMFKHYPTQLENALMVLQNAGYILYDKDPDSKPRVFIKITREELNNIERLSAIEEATLTTLLRYHGTLFTELTYIDEGFIAAHAGITDEQIRVALKELSQRGIINYIPRRNIPIITYLQQRIDSDRLRIPKEVYEVLQKRLAERVDAMLKYTETSHICRQRILMAYFDEVEPNNCGCCDVCLSGDTNEEVLEEYRNMVYGLLSDGERHLAAELNSLNIPQKPFREILEELRQDIRVKQDGPYITLLD